MNYEYDVRYVSGAVDRIATSYELTIDRLESNPWVYNLVDGQYVNTNNIEVITHVKRH